MTDWLTILYCVLSAAIVVYSVLRLVNRRHFVLPNMALNYIIGISIVTLIFSTLVTPVKADLCAKGAKEIDGNWFCQPVKAIQYSNVGAPGTYNQVTEMTAAGCDFAPKSFAGPIAPLNEEVSLHFRGPIHIKQIAAYTPSNFAAKRDSVNRIHDSAQNSFHKRQARHGHGVEGKRQEAYATIDGQLVSWDNNWFGPSSGASTWTEPVMVTATIDGQHVSWENNWFGPSTDTPASTEPQMITATIDGKFVSWADVGTAPSSTAYRSTTTETHISTFTTTICRFAASESAVASQPTAPVQSPVRPSVPVQSSVNPPISVPSSIDSSDPVQHPSKPSSSVQNPVKSSVPVQSSVTFPISPGMEFERIAYYDSESQTAENITFLGNFGGQGSGVFNDMYGASAAYSNSYGTGGSATSQILADVLIPSRHEIYVMLAQDCNDGTCGFFRPGSVAHHGFDGADKIFMVEFSMPMDGQTGFEGNQPAFWMLNSHIVRTMQYGNCSCWPACGELDIAESLFPGSTYLKSTLHDNYSGGDSNYFERPVTGTMKMAVIFSSATRTVNIRVLPDAIEFGPTYSDATINKMVGSEVDLSNFVIS